MYGVPNRIEKMRLNHYIRQREAQQRRFFGKSYNAQKSIAARNRENRQSRKVIFSEIESMIFYTGGILPDRK